MTSTAGQAPGPFGLGPDDAARLSQAVEDLHADTGSPRADVLAAIVTVALGHRDEIAAVLASRRLDEVLAGLPADTRDLPDLSRYDRLLTVARPA
jgi:hypothetical protein